MCYVHPIPLVKPALRADSEHDQREEAFTQNPHIYPGKRGKPLQVRLHVVQPVGGLGPLHEPPGLPLMLFLLLPVHLDLPVADKLGGLAAHKEVLLLCAIAIKEAEFIRSRPGILCNCHQVPTCGKRRRVRKGYVLCSLIRLRFLYHDNPHVSKSESDFGPIIRVGGAYCGR